MIARTWRGWTRPEDSDAYLVYVERTGGRAARETPGNRGYYILRREDGDRMRARIEALNAEAQARQPGAAAKPEGKP